MSKKVAMIQIASVVLAGALIGLGAGWLEDTSYQEGYTSGMEAKTLELAEVFAPYGYEKIRMAKVSCEAKSGMVYQIYGGFAPFIMAKKEEPNTKMGPL